MRKIVQGVLVHQGYRRGHPKLAQIQGQLLERFYIHETTQIHCIQLQRQQIQEQREVMEITSECWDVVLGLIWVQEHGEPLSMMMAQNCESDLAGICNDQAGLVAPLDDF